MEWQAEDVIAENLQEYLNAITLEKFEVYGIYPITHRIKTRVLAQRKLGPLMPLWSFRGQLARHTCTPAHFFFPAKIEPRGGLVGDLPTNIPVLL
jgi:hypothetical protein